MGRAYNFVAEYAVGDFVIKIPCSLHTLIGVAQFIDLPCHDYLVIIRQWFIIKLLTSPSHFTA